MQDYANMVSGLLASARLAKHHLRDTNLSWEQRCAKFHAVFPYDTPFAMWGTSRDVFAWSCEKPSADAWAGRVWSMDDLSSLTGTICSDHDGVVWTGNSKSVRIAELTTALRDNGIDVHKGSDANTIISAAYVHNLSAEQFREEVSAYIDAWDTHLKHAKELRDSLFTAPHLRKLGNHLDRRDAAAVWS